jgi:hypothetical protein
MSLSAKRYIPFQIIPQIVPRKTILFMSKIQCYCTIHGNRSHSFVPPQTQKNTSCPHQMRRPPDVNGLPGSSYVIVVSSLKPFLLDERPAKFPSDVQPVITRANLRGSRANHAREIWTLLAPPLSANALA